MGFDSLDPTVGTYVPNVELLYEYYAAPLLRQGLERQDQTIHNRNVSKGKVRRVSRPYEKQMAAFTKRMAGLEDQILKATGKEKENLMKDRDQLKVQIDNVQATIKAAIQQNKNLKRIRGENKTLNLTNQAARYLLSQTAPKLSGALGDYIGVTDVDPDEIKGEGDVSGARTTFVPPTGFTGFLFGAGG